MDEMTIDSKAVAKLLGGQNGQNHLVRMDLYAKILKECGSKIPPILVIIFNGSLAGLPLIARALMYGRTGEQADRYV